MLPKETNIWRRDEGKECNNSCDTPVALPGRQKRFSVLQDNKSGLVDVASLARFMPDEMLNGENMIPQKITQ
jgi:hypothetical protein